MNTAALPRLRSMLERALPWAAVLLTVAAVLAGFLWVEARPARRFVVFYIAPMVLVLPALVPRPSGARRVGARGLHRAGRGGGDPGGGAHADRRAAVLRPHALTYSLLTTPRRWYRVVAVLLSAETTWFKLGMWSDVRSWSLGLAAGLVSTGIWAMLGRRRIEG